MLAQGVQPTAYLYNLLLRTARDCNIGDIQTANRVLLRPVQSKNQETPALTTGSRPTKGGRSKVDQKLERMKGAVPLSGKKAEMVVLETMYVDYSEDSVEGVLDAELPSVDSSTDDGTAIGDGRTPFVRRDTNSPVRRLHKSHQENQQSSSASESDHWWDTSDNRTDFPQTFHPPPAQITPRSVKNSSESDFNALAVTDHSDVQLRTSNSLAQVPNLLDVSADFSNVQSLAVVSEPADRLALLGGAQGVLGHMTQSEVKPDVKGLSLLAEILPGNEREENQLMEYVEEHKVKVDVDFYNVFIRRRTRRKDLTAAKVSQEGL